MKKTSTINFVLNIDQNYIKPSTVTMTSILCNLDKKYNCNFYVYFKNFTSKPKEYKILENKYKCKIFCIDSRKYQKLFNKIDKNALFKSRYQNYWKSLIPFYRLLMFKFLPNNVDYAFYIDADAIVDGDLSKVYKNTIKENKLFATVVDVFFLKKWRRNKRYYKKYPEFNKLISDRYKYPYFCSGFYLANIKKCKKLKIFEQLFDFFIKHPNIQLADQDILNAIFSQKHSDLITYLHPKYDVFMDGKCSTFIKSKKVYYSKEQLIEAFSKPVVLHYAGWRKPWITLKCCRGVERWWFYHDKSPANMPRIK